jgi:hypothetical protein
MNRIVRSGGDETLIAEIAKKSAALCQARRIYPHLEA